MNAIPLHCIFVILPSARQSLVDIIESKSFFYFPDIFIIAWFVLSLYELRYISLLKERNKCVCRRAIWKLSRIIDLVRVACI